MDTSELEAAILKWPIGAREKLAWLFTPTKIRSDKRKELEAALLLAVVGWWQDEPKKKPIAERLHAELESYRRGAWQFEKHRTSPADERRALLHRILTLANGRVPSGRTLRALFADVAR